jgi:predicted nucleic acid-binding protein
MSCKEIQDRELVNCDAVSCGFQRWIVICLLHRLHGISFWDALIVKAAKQAACGVLLSEDLQHGWTVDGLKIENPFRHLVGDFG